MQINYFKIISRGLIGLLFLIAPLQAVYSLTFTVDDPSDFTDATPGDGKCDIGTNLCTLRAAVQEANAWPGADYIILPANTYSLATQLGVNEDSAATGDIDISEDLVITGAGAASTIIDGGRAIPGNTTPDRVFQILAGTTVAITGVTIQNGSTSNIPSGNQGGGGIYNAGTLTLTDSTVTSNDSGQSGGGIHNEQGILTIRRSSIINNTKSGSSGANLGGGIGALFGTTTIIDSVISGNTAFGSGGGVNLTNGTMTITNSIIDSNAATGQTGGGISNSGDVTVVNSAVTNNTARNGGGYYSTGQGTATFTNTTISGNTVDVDGGGLFNHTTLSLIHTTVSDNSATTGLGDGLYTDSTGSTTVATSTLRHSLIADNNGNDCDTRSVDSVVSEGYNRDSDGTCGLAGTGDATDTVANLNFGALGSNGGFTQTHALAAGSTALDTVPLADCPPPDDDQRGATRPDGGAGFNCDTGSFERVAAETTAVDLRVTIDDNPDPVLLGGGNLTYTITVTNLGPNDASNVTLTDTLPGSVNYVSDTGGCTPAVPTVTCTVGNDNATPGNINTGSSFSIDIVVTPTSLGTISNSVTAGATEADLNSANNTNITEDTLVTTTTDLGITKVKTNPPTEPVLVTDDITYRLTVNNTGSDTGDITVTDTLPAGSTLVSATGTNWTCTGTSTVTCVRTATLTAGGSSTVDIVMTPPVLGGTVTNTAYVTFNGVDPDTSNNISSLDTDTLAVADLGVDITESNDPAEVDADFDYLVNVTNNGPSPATNLALTVTLPAAVTLKNIGGASGWSCSGTTTISCTRPSLAQDTNSVLIFTVNAATAAPSSAPLSITAGITSDTFDPDSSNDSASEQTVVNPPAVTVDNADINLVSIFDTPDPVIAGNNLKYTSTIRNLGPDTARNVVLTVILPDSVTFVSSDPQCSATIVGATLQLSCVIGSMAVNTTVTVDMTVIPTLGDRIITASASVINTLGDDPNVTNNDNSKEQDTQVNEPASNGGTPGVGTSSGGACFIATAAYGSYLDPHVMVLRRFRDDYLLTNDFGTHLVDFYYATSPPLADFIRQHESFRMLTRWALTPLVYGVEYPFGALAISILLISGISYRRLRKPA